MHSISTHSNAHINKINDAIELGAAGSMSPQRAIDSDTVLCILSRSGRKIKLIRLGL